jgi:hypothetical protein
MSAEQRVALAAALWLGSQCPATGALGGAGSADPTTTTTTHSTNRKRAVQADGVTSGTISGITTVHVDPGSTRRPPSNVGSRAVATVPTVGEAIALVRELAGPSNPKRIVLSPGVHFLGINGTLTLSAADSNLVIESSPDGQAWLSGGVPLGKDLQWTKGERGVWSTSLRGRLPAGTTVEALLRLNPHTRIERARYPNANTETAQWGYNSPLRLNYSFGANETIEWLRPPLGGSTPSMSFFDFSSLPNAAGGHLIKNDSAMAEYNTYVGGSGGVCDNWDTSDGQESYWCSNKSAGGWAEVDFKAINAGQLGLPVGVKYNASLRPGRFQKYANAAGGIIHAWHSQSWFVNMWEIVSHDLAGDAFKFGRGGSQGGRSWCREWLPACVIHPFGPTTVLAHSSSLSHHTQAAINVHTPRRGAIRKRAILVSSPVGGTSKTSLKSSTPKTSELCDLYTV